MNIEEVTSDDSRVMRLIILQKQHALAHTPPGSGHALEVGAEEAGVVRYFLALDGGEPVGCIGLKRLGSGEGEIKTMHVVEDRRGLGFAGALLERLIVAARELGMTKLKLETGRSEGFAASRRFYRKAGFDECERFGPYRSDDFSFCMEKAI